MLINIPEYDEAPVMPKQYDMYYNRIANKIYIYNNQWVEYDVSAFLPEKYVVRDKLTRVNYLGRDWGTFVNELRARLVEKFPAYEDFLESDLGMVLIDILAYGFDGLAWYQDKWASEMFLETATLKRSVIRLARQLGYIPRGATPARVKLSFRIDGPKDYTVIIPKGYKVKADDLVFETEQEGKILSSTLGVEDVYAIEGEIKNLGYFSTGHAWQKYILFKDENKQIAAGSVKVAVGGLSWKEVDFWGYSGDNEYKVYTEDNVSYVLFGDGVVAKIPDIGMSIDISYRVCSGSKGNVAVGTIKEIINPIYIRGENIYLSVTNRERAFGGADEEDVFKIKNLAPRVFQSQDRGVSINDYESLILKYSDTYGSVAKVKGVYVNDVITDAVLTTLLNKIIIVRNKFTANDYWWMFCDEVYKDLKLHFERYFNSRKSVNLLAFYLLSKDTRGQYCAPPGIYLNIDPEVNPLLAYINSKKTSTVSVMLLDGSVFIRKCAIDLSIKTKALYDFDVVKQKVKDAILGMFVDKDFGEALRLSDVYAVVENVEGISYSRITLKLKDTDGIEINNNDIVCKSQSYLIGIDENDIKVMPI